MRGGEKVLENFCKIYPDAEIYTHVYNPNNISSLINSHSVHTTFINYLPFSNKLYKYYLPLMPLALKFVNLNKFDLIISLESGPSKGFRKNKKALHVCYCHTPMRYLYDMKNLYLKDYSILFRKLIELVIFYLKKWDLSTSRSIDIIIANSNFVSNRIKKYWNRNSEVIHPSINLSDFTLADKKKDYYLILSELVEYKRIDIAINAFNKNKKKLYVIGDGPLMNKYKKISKSNIKFLSSLSNGDRNKHLSNCKALIFPGIEDFGIVPIESMASGTPVIAYKKGGALDYLKEDINGMFFNEQNSKSLIKFFKANLTKFKLYAS